MLFFYFCVLLCKPNSVNLIAKVHKDKLDHLSYYFFLVLFLQLVGFEGGSFEGADNEVVGDDTGSIVFFSATQKDVRTNVDASILSLWLKAKAISC